MIQMNKLKRFIELINSLRDIIENEYLFDKNKHWENLQEFMQIYNDYPSIYHELNNEDRQRFIVLRRIYDNHLKIPGRSQ